MPPQPGAISPSNRPTHWKDSSEKLPKSSWGIAWVIISIIPTFYLLSSGTHSRRGEHYNLHHSDSSSSLVQRHPISSLRLLHDTPHLNHCATQGSSPSDLPTPKHISSHPFSKHATFSIPYLTTSEVPHHTSSSWVLPHLTSFQPNVAALHTSPSALPFLLAHRN